MKLRKLTLFLSIIIIFIIILSITFYQYKSYATLTNNFIATVLAKINNEYPNIAIEDIIAIVNAENYETSSDILTSYGFTENDISILETYNKTFKDNLLCNSIIFLILTLIILMFIYFLKRKERKELIAIINYLKELNRGNYNLQIDLNSEGTISILKNEIYTTTIMLKEQAEKEQKDKINLKNSLTNISHQLKTPLTSISLLVDNLCDNDIDKTTSKEFLNDIKYQIENINYLIITLLKLSRFDANVIIFKKDKINIKNLIFEVLKQLDVIRDLKNINIHVNGATNITIIGDYHWEFEALSNILKNCLEYTPENKNIYLIFKDNNVYTEIQIVDEGPGMSQDEQKHIFERFYKGINSASNNFGIGLSLAKEIITKDNGTIKVYSELDDGTTFKIRYYK